MSVGHIKNHYCMYIFTVFKKLATYKIYKQSVRSSISGIVASIKISVIILTEFRQFQCFITEIT